MSSAMRNALASSPKGAALGANALMGGAPTSKLNRRFPGAAIQPEPSPPLPPIGSAVQPPAMPASMPLGQPAPRPAQQAIAPHPADDMNLLGRHLAARKLSKQDLIGLVKGEDHTVHATGTLLKIPGDITQQELDAALSRAVRGGKIVKQAVDNFARALPPVSNQNALRKALMVQRERSIRALVVLHAEAQRRGIRLAAVQDPNLKSAIQ